MNKDLEAAAAQRAAGDVADVLAENRELLRRFRAGDREALREVYLAYVDHLSRALRAGFVLDGTPPRRVPGVRDTSELLDALQDAFARAFAERARVAYDGLRPYAHYLRRIALNARIDHLRAQGREAVLEARDAAELSDREAPQPISHEAELHGKRQREAARAVVAGLGAEAQRFVELRFVLERSQDEVAAAMGITRRRVRTLEEQVLSALRRQLQKERLL